MGREDLVLRGKRSLATKTGIKLQRLIVTVTLSPNQTKKVLKSPDKKRDREYISSHVTNKTPTSFTFSQRDIRCMDHKKYS